MLEFSTDDEQDPDHVNICAEIYACLDQFHDEIEPGFVRTYPCLEDYHKVTIRRTS